MHRRCVLTKDVLAKADALLWSINDYLALATMAGRRVTRGYKACCQCYQNQEEDVSQFATSVLTKDVLAKADTLLWSINDYPALETMARRRVVGGYKACCHCYQKHLSKARRVEDVSQFATSVLTKDVLAKADALLWSISDYTTLGTLAGRRVVGGYKAYCHCYQNICQ